jgi:3-carboxy-cis,cis-muconate cycloisomerase
MTSLVLESKVFSNMFGTPAMRAVFSDETLVQRYLDVEAALARVQGRLGIIPEEAAREIEAKCDVTRVDFERLRARSEVVGYPILPLVEQLTGWCTGDAGQYCHWGATTQDIMDCADVLQIRDALALLSADLEAVGAALASLAEEHKHTPMAGRSHLQHALPITFGYKCAVWLSSMDRHLQRLDDLRPRLLTAQFSGAAGTLASLGKDGLPVQEALAQELGLAPPAITWHTARDSLAEASGLLAMITATLGKIGYDVMLMMQSEIGEVFEPFVPGRGASSTMPQKRNPIASELLLASSKIVRQLHGGMLDALVQDHERATGQWHVEWHVLPEAFVVTAGALSHAREMLVGLQVREDAMRRNLDRTGGLIVSEAVMMGLAPHLGRGRAHDVVYECCRESLEKGASFVEALAAHPEIAAALERKQIEKLADPASYLGSAPEMVARYLAARDRRSAR